MAKDVPNKPVSSSSNNTTDNTSPSISDQQKVPPLRIVLNTSGNQKSSSTAIAVSANQQQSQPSQQQSLDIKREKLRDGKSDANLKTSGRVRIKLGTNKQQKSNTHSSESSSNSNNDSQRNNKGSIVERTDNNSQESTINLSHLRRITRRSQRSVQAVNNEDEESISSMTSTDENQNTTNTNNSDNNSGQDTASAVASSNQSNANSSVAPNTTNSSLNAETPRRYKRRKGEQTECPPGEQDGAFNFQNYKLPVQNSFELYKNIRKQVDKKLRNLTCIHPKTPHGFRDYMLNRGAYLLDGNKLGNGTNLFMNEDGGLHPAPLGKYRALRHNRVNYSVPNRAKVPLGLAVNSPLYNLFIEQEKERYRMRMQHIKEREKLTLAAEQEIIRVYNQAAMAAANQLEPFSACTMLKHQEIYNYLDSDGVTILASDDAQQEQASNKQEEARSRRRHHEQISPPTTRKGSNAEELPPADSSQKNSKTPSTQTATTTTPPPTSTTTTTTAATTTISTTTETHEPQKDESDSSKPTDEEDSQERIIKIEKQSSSEEGETSSDVKSTCQDKEVISEDKSASQPVPETAADEALDDKLEIKSEPKADAELSKDTDPETKKESNKVTGSPTSVNDDKSVAESQQKQSTNLSPSAPICPENAESEDHAGVTNNQVVPMEQESESHVDQVTCDEHVLSDDDRQAYNKEVFLSQLQDIDDKWDKIRNEMLIRHRNEAESLYAVQRLEWEWKTKEIGACDVRTTPVIDDILVPRLNIYSQDY